MSKKERSSELQQILEKVFDGDKATKEHSLLRERVSLETVLDVSASLAPKRRGRKAKI